MPNLAWDMPNLAWDMPNLDMVPNLAWDMPNLAWDMPNQWARTAQGPTIGPERPRVQQLGPNGPGSNNWARTAQGPTNGPERHRVPTFYVPQWGEAHL